MLRSLVGSEMCIRDSIHPFPDNASTIRVQDRLINVYGDYSDGDTAKIGLPIGNMDPSGEWYPHSPSGVLKFRGVVVGAGGRTGTTTDTSKTLPFVPDVASGEEDVVDRIIAAIRESGSGSYDRQSTPIEQRLPGITSDRNGEYIPSSDLIGLEKEIDLLMEGKYLDLYDPTVLATSRISAVNRILRFGGFLPGWGRGALKWLGVTALSAASWEFGGRLGTGNFELSPSPSIDLGIVEVPTTPISSLARAISTVWAHRGYAEDVMDNPSGAADAAQAIVDTITVDRDGININPTEAGQVLTPDALSFLTSVGARAADDPETAQRLAALAATSGLGAAVVALNSGQLFENNNGRPNLRPRLGPSVEVEGISVPDPSGSIPRDDSDVISKLREMGVDDVCINYARNVLEAGFEPTFDTFRHRECFEAYRSIKEQENMATEATDMEEITPEGDDS